MVGRGQKIFRLALMVLLASSCLAPLLVGGTAEQEKMTLFDLKLPVYQGDSAVPTAILYAKEARPIGVNFELKGVRLVWIGETISIIRGVVTTPAAAYDRSTNLVSGNKWIRYRSKELDIDGVGFDIDQLAQTIHLRSKVKVTIKGKMESNRERRLREQAEAKKRKKSGKLHLKPVAVEMLRNIAAGTSSSPSKSTKTRNNAEPRKGRDSRSITTLIRVALVAAIVLFLTSWLYSRSKRRAT